MLNRETVSKEVFKIIVMERVKNHLPTEYKDVELRIETVDKVTESYEGLIVTFPNSDYAASINLDHCYAEYLNGRDLVEVIESIAEQATMTPPFDFNDLPDMTVYDNIKDRLYVKLTSGEGKEKLLDKIPHKCVEDLIVTFHIMLDDASVTINDQLLDGYGITVDELYETALENSQRILPSSVSNISDALGVEGSAPLTVVTNNQQIYGAATILYPHVLDGLSTGEKIYVLPSSIHEVLVYCGDKNVSDLKEMVLAANSGVVDPEDKLSDHVYTYENGKLVIAA